MGHLGVVVFFAKWLPLVEVPSLPPRAGLPARPVYRRGSRPPGCREFRPQARYKQHCRQGALRSGRRPHEDAEARTSLHAPWLPGRAAHGPCAAALCLGCRRPRAGLHSAATLSGTGCCTAAPAVTHALVRRPHALVRRPALGGTWGRGAASPPGQRFPEHWWTSDLPEPRAFLPDPGKSSPRPGMGQCHGWGNSNSLSDVCKKLGLPNIFQGNGRRGLSVREPWDPDGRQHGHPWGRVSEPRCTVAVPGPGTTSLLWPAAP